MYPIYCNNSSKEKEALSASNELAEHHEVTKLSAALDEPNNEQSTNSVSKDPYEEEVTPFGYSVVDMKNVSEYNNSNNVITMYFSHLCLYTLLQSVIFQSFAFI